MKIKKRRREVRRMVGKGQGRVKSGFRARLATVAVTRGSVALTDGRGNGRLAGTDH